MKDKFKAKPVHLVPILATLLFGAVCAFLLLESQADLYPVTPFQEGVGSLFNALYFVILAGVGATVLYLLLRRKNIRSITIITGFALTAASLMLSFIYLWAAFSILSFPYMPALILVSILSILMAVLADVAIFRNHRRAAELSTLLLGGALGSFLGASIPTLSATLILGALAIYDIFAVYRGPVGKIADTGLDKLRGLSFYFKDIQVGLGDLTFYSMLTSLALVNTDLILWVASTVGVLIGAFLAFKMLERKGIFPGLPFPVTLGLLPLIIYFFLSGGIP